MNPRIIVVPPSAETGEIAREMAPAGFDLVLVRDDRPEMEAALGERRIHSAIRPDHEGRILSHGAAASGWCNC